MLDPAPWAVSELASRREVMGKAAAARNGIKVVVGLTVYRNQLAFPCIGAVRHCVAGSIGEAVGTRQISGQASGAADVPRRAIAAADRDDESISKGGVDGYYLRARGEEMGRRPGRGVERRQAVRSCLWTLRLIGEAVDLPPSWELETL